MNTANKNRVVGYILETYQKIDSTTFQNVTKYFSVTEMKDEKISETDLVLSFEFEESLRVQFELVIFGTLCHYPKNCIFIGAIKKVLSNENNEVKIGNHTLGSKLLSFQFDYFYDLSVPSLLHLFFE